MHLNIPKSDNKYHWTQHCIRKMLFYGLTADRIKRVMRNPKRVENGVAENTIAVMTLAGTINKPSEIWVMYQQQNQNSPPKADLPRAEKFKSQNFGRKIIISAWRYPGVSPVGKQIPIPADILEELKKEGILVQ